MAMKGAIRVAFDDVFGQGALLLANRTARLPFHDELPSEKDLPFLKLVASHVESALHNAVLARDAELALLHASPALVFAVAVHRVAGDLKHATDIMNNAFSFGNHQGVDQKAREYVAGKIGDFVRARAKG